MLLSINELWALQSILPGGSDFTFAVAYMFLFLAMVGQLAKAQCLLRSCDCVVGGVAMVGGVDSLLLRG